MQQTVKFYRVAVEAMQVICQARYEAFGNTGHTDKIKGDSIGSNG